MRIDVWPHAGTSCEGLCERLCKFMDVFRACLQVSGWQRLFLCAPNNEEGRTLIECLLTGSLNRRTSSPPQLPPS